MNNRRESKESEHEPKGCQDEKQMLQDHALERSKFCFVRFSSRQNGKNSRGALVGLTQVKGTRVERFFV